MKMPVLAIYGVAKPAVATSYGLGFAPCSSLKHAFSSPYKDRAQALGLYGL
jgi:hypothetical protein